MPTPKPEANRREAHVHGLVTNRMKLDFTQYCRARGLTVSDGLQELIRAALHADPRTARLRAYRPAAEAISGESRDSPVVPART